MYWIESVQYKSQCWAVVNTVIDNVTKFNKGSEFLY